jgi:hypothetical protein
MAVPSTLSSSVENDDFGKGTKIDGNSAFKTVNL